ncbi:uncharacterized protein LOC111986395 [Quercus suber]|uniref:uncharacterized protein LOC111986395 n=1 Tax=Quercus suber TaxID=58331 RepID=UPI000CE26691|nr:uncharacterized protein LOC111986395 [Quercus suber]
MVQHQVGATNLTSALEKFRKLDPLAFKCIEDPVETNNWLKEIERLFRAIEAHVLNTEAPELALVDDTEQQRDAFNKWHEADAMAKCYIMAFMTNVLQKQCQGLATAQDMMLHLKEMFGEQSKSAWQTTMKNHMSTKMVEGTLVQEHVLKVISFINELDMLGAKIDSETQVEAILASLPDSFKKFIMNYNMNKVEVTLSELLNMLKVAKDLIKKKSL